MQVNEGVPDEGIRFQAKFNDLGVELGAGGGRGELGAGPEEEGKGELVGPSAAPLHPGVEGEGVDRGGGVGGAADDGVPHEEVRMGDLVEQAAGVEHGARDRDSGGEKELSEGGGVGEVASDDHEGVDLLEREEALTPLPYSRSGSFVAGFSYHELPQGFSETRKMPARLVAKIRFWCKFLCQIK